MESGIVANAGQQNHITNITAARGDGTVVVRSEPTNMIVSQSVSQVVVDQWITVTE